MFRDGETPLFTLGMSSHLGTSRKDKCCNRFDTSDTTLIASMIVDLPALFLPTMTVVDLRGIVCRLKHLKF